jgi:hypothetical protein
LRLIRELTSYSREKGQVMQHWIREYLLMK